MAYLPTPFTPSWATMAPAIQPAQPQQPQGLIWVDGEVGAKAYQLPAGWPANTPLALWDTNDTVIYLKSTNQMGMPNPLQVARYELIEYRGMSRRGEERGKAWDEEMKELYASREELHELRDEIERMKKEAAK